ncbi:NADB-Rossmann family domain-containing protein [Colletotrichum incanum]|nr:NADB-Rossmann family domain-containing protein [Colletotrichum incanum]
MVLISHSADESEFSAPARQAAERLAKFGLKFTRFANGLFMDLFCQPNIPRHLRRFFWAIDIGKRQAAIPGTGTEVFIMTYSKDVAQFGVRILDENEWLELSIVSGSDATFKEILVIAERVTNSLEKLRKGDARRLSEEYTSYGGEGPVAMAAVNIGASAI